MKHLFLLCGEGGGSSLLKHMICQCENVAFFDKEGDGVWEDYGPGSRIINQRKKPAHLMMHYFEDESNYSWGHIQSRWDGLWKKKDDDRIYFQKSTTDYTRWNLLVNKFCDTHFIIMLRNPFAHIEGMYRKCTWDISIEEMAQGWCNMMMKQMECHQSYDKQVLFTFEELCLGIEEVEYKIKALMNPDLQDFTTEVEFKHQHNRRDFASPPHHGIGFNVGSINRLSFRDIYKIKKVLEPYEEQLDYLGYKL